MKAGVLPHPSPPQLGEGTETAVADLGSSPKLLTITHIAVYQRWLAFRGRPTRNFVNQRFSGPSPERCSTRELMGNGKPKLGEVRWG